MPMLSVGGKIKGIVNIIYDVHTLKESGRYLIAKISTIDYNLIVAMTHSDSKLYSKNNRQAANLRQFHEAISMEQETHKCENVLAIGDFNANPFEDSCLGADNLFAQPFADEVISSPTRDVGEKTYQKFYNPTWKFFGNRTAPFTTYHYVDSGDMANCHWNVLDQVIIRPQLIKAFDDEQLKIISSTKNHQLLRNGKPDSKNYSDHLPLFCVLKEELI